MTAAVCRPYGLGFHQPLLLRVTPQRGVIRLRQQTAGGIDLAGQRQVGMAIQRAAAKGRAVAGEILPGHPVPDFAAFRNDDGTDILCRQCIDRVDPGEIPRHERGRRDTGALVPRRRRRRGRGPGQRRRRRQRRHEAGLQRRQVAVVQYVLARLVGDVLADHGGHEGRLAPDGVEFLGFGRAGREAAQPGRQGLVVGGIEHVGAGHGAEGKNLIDSHGIVLIQPAKSEPQSPLSNPEM
ncbi:Uncharacterised protein [Achromobacter xylosoxidans]|nr:Uncharacterised protein [Achromobacter xylosoxidans]